MSFHESFLLRVMSMLPVFVSFKNRFIVSKNGHVKSWVQLSPMVLFTRKVKNFEGAAYKKGETPTVCLNAVNAKHVKAHKSSSAY